MIQWDAFIGRISGRLRVNGVEALLQHLPMSLVVTIVFETYEVLNLFIIGSVRKIESTQSTSKNLTNRARIKSRLKIINFVVRRGADGTVTGGSC